MEVFEIGRETYPKFEQEICQLYADIFDLKVPEKYELGEDKLLVVSFHGEVIAMCMLQWLKTNSIWYLYNFGVKFGYRRQGVGEFLWRGMLKFTQNKIMWYVDPENFPARSFYHKLGATVLEETDRRVTMVL